jgi:hypothetical protein
MPRSDTHRHAPEQAECRNCGAMFDLARQYYYDDLCPTCKEKEDGRDAVDPVVGTCYVCGDEVRKSQQCWSRQAAPPDVHGDVLVCRDDKGHRWTPDAPV